MAESYEYSMINGTSSQVNFFAPVPVQVSVTSVWLPVRGLAVAYIVSVIFESAQINILVKAFSSAFVYAKFLYLKNKQTNVKYIGWFLP